MWHRNQANEARTTVLRVFGIYTHAQIDGRLWSAVSQQSSGKGREYRRRYAIVYLSGCRPSLIMTSSTSFFSCTFRRAPVHPGDRLVPPQVFTPLDAAEAESPVQPPIIPDLRPEDREELHALLVYVDRSSMIISTGGKLTTPRRLGKYVTFSQAFLNSG